MECKESGYAILCQISCHYIYHLSKGKVQHFNNKNDVTLVRAKKGQKVDWAHIIFNSLCNELDRWYKYVKENKGDTKIHVNLPRYWQKSFSICLCIKRRIHKNHWPRLKKIGRRCKQH